MSVAPHLDPRPFHHPWRPRALSIALATVTTMAFCAWLLSSAPERPPTPAAQDGAEPPSPPPREGEAHAGLSSP